MKEELKTLFNLGYQCGTATDIQTNNLKETINTICEKHPDPVYSAVFKKGIEEGVKDKTHQRLDELEKLKKTKGKDLER